MYDLEINFLKDRHQDIPKETMGRRAALSIGETVPLVAGIATAVLLPVLVFSYLGILNNQKQEIAQKIEQGKQEIQQLQVQNKNIKAIEAEVAQSRDEVAALVTVFNQVKPLSVFLREIRDQIPANVEINVIGQSETAPPAPGGGQANQPKPQTIITVKGFAKSFAEVNDFLLTLKSSEFFNPDNINIVEAKEIENPKNQTEGDIPDYAKEKIRGSSDLKPLPDYIKVKYPKVVEFSIAAEASDKPASALKKELQAKGGQGIVTRITTLEQKGAIKP